MLSINEYAKDKGISNRSVWRLVEQGKLNTVKKGRTTYIVKKGSVTSVTDGTVTTVTGSVTSVTRPVTSVTRELSVRGKPDKEIDWSLAIQRVSNEELLAEVKRRGLLRWSSIKASKSSHRASGGSSDKGSGDIFKEAERRGTTVVELMKTRGRKR